MEGGLPPGRLQLELRQVADPILVDLVGLGLKLAILLEELLTRLTQGFMTINTAVLSLALLPS